MRGLAAVLGAAALVAVLSTTGSAAPTATVTTFTLTKSEVLSNPNSNELTIDAAGQKASQHHCCDGGKWDIEYYWKVPGSFTTQAETFPATLGISSMTAVPVQPLLIQTTIRFPDFAQPFQLHYPDQTSGSKDFQIPIGAYLKGWKDPVQIIVGVVSAEVGYTYTPETTTTGGVEKSATEPPPGGSTTVTSPKTLPASGTVTTTVKSTGSDLGGTTIVAPGGRGETVGEAVAACFFLGPDAFATDDPSARIYLDNAFIRDLFAAAKTPHQQLVLCIALAKVLKPVHDKYAATGAGSCHAQAVVIAGTKKNGKLSLRFVKTKPPGARYTCSGSGNNETIKASGALRNALGTHQTFGVVRQKGASARGAKLTFSFR